MQVVTNVTRRLQVPFTPYIIYKT